MPHIIKSYITKNREKISLLWISSLIVASLSIAMFTRVFQSLDELWIYNMGCQYARGKLPYKDFSVLVPPLSMVLSAMALKLAGEELIVLRGLGVIILSCTVLIAYQIIYEKTGKVVYSEGVCAGICAYYGMQFSYDYNYLNLLILMTLMRLYLGLAQYRVKNRKGIWLIISLCEMTNRFKAA